MNKVLCQKSVWTLEENGYLRRLNKGREILHCKFPSDVVENFEAKPLDPLYYKTLCLYIRCLGKRLSPAENNVARALAEFVSGPQHNATVKASVIEPRVGMGIYTGEILRTLRRRGILGLIGGIYQGGHYPNTYRFRGVQRFLKEGITKVQAEASQIQLPVRWKPFDEGKERFFQAIVSLPIATDQDCLLLGVPVGGRIAGRKNIEKELGITSWSTERYSEALRKESRLTRIIPAARPGMNPYPPSVWYPRVTTVHKENAVATKATHPKKQNPNYNWTPEDTDKIRADVKQPPKESAVALRDHEVPLPLDEPPPCFKKLESLPGKYDWPALLKHDDTRSWFYNVRSWYKRH